VDIAPIATRIATPKFSRKTLSNKRKAAFGLKAAIQSYAVEDATADMSAVSRHALRMGSGVTTLRLVKSTGR
jgi:hypothetical protein